MMAPTMETVITIVKITDKTMPMMPQTRAAVVLPLLPDSRTAALPRMMATMPRIKPRIGPEKTMDSTPTTTAAVAFPDGAGAPTYPAPAMPGFGWG